MSDYTKVTSFLAKDSLTTGDPGKIIKGSEIDEEFNLIAAAVASKADLDSPNFTGTPSLPTGTTGVKQAAGTNSTLLATTSFVNDERTNTATLTNKTISGSSNTITNVSLSTGVTGTLPVANGGTGTTSLTANNVLLGNGTSAVQAVAPGTSGNVLKSNGTTWTSGTITIPSFGVTAASDTFGTDTTIAVPSNTIFVVGDFFVSWAGSGGARCSVQLKNSGGGVIDEFYIGGGNELNGNDGGSGMSNRTQFMFAVPSTCTSIRFYRSSGGAGISGNVNQWVTFS